MIRDSVYSEFWLTLTLGAKKLVELALNHQQRKCCQCGQPFLPGPVNRHDMEERRKKWKKHLESHRQRQGREGERERKRERERERGGGREREIDRRNKNSNNNKKQKKKKKKKKKKSK